MSFPISAILAVVFLLISIILHRFAGGTRMVRGLGSRKAACVLLAVGAILLLTEGTWSIPIHLSLPFATYLLVLLLALSLSILNSIKQGTKMGFILNHLGIFLIIWASMFGHADVRKTQMTVGRGESVNFSYRNDGLVTPLPFAVELRDFHIDYYEDGVSPRQFTSDLTIDGKEMSVAVNEPATYMGYTFYQQSYDHEYGYYTVLQVLCDPWMPVVYVGMVLLAMGSVMLLFSRWRAKVILPVTLVLTVLFTGLTVAKINFGTLMPALRSWWFVPHLFIYMVAYSLMALALVLWLLAAIKHKEDWKTTSNHLVRSASALLIIGMLTGSVWARQAWGDYWAWDPKENWAAVTWFVSLMHLHLQDKRGWKAITILILAFLALQITWYGVNYLPSAGNSMHTYN